MNDRHCAAGTEPCVCAIANLEDASRYRYLRNQIIENNFPCDGLFIGRIPDNTCLTGEDADAAIDAMILAAESKNVA